MSDIVISGGPLQRFLSMVGFQYDYVRSAIENLRDTNDPWDCPGNLLPLLAAELGLTYEAHIGMSQNRELLGNLVKCYQTKGTVAGIENLVLALTGWSSTCAIGPNLSNTLYSEPRSYFTNTNITSVPMGTQVFTPGVVGPLWPAQWYAAGYSGVGLPYLASWFGTYQSSAPVPATLYFATGAANWLNGASYADFCTAFTPGTTTKNAQNYGIAITAGATQLSSAVLVFITGMSATFHYWLEFFDMHGNSLGTSPSVVDSHTYAGTQTGFDIYTVQAVAVPTGAVWVAPHLQMYNTGVEDIITSGKAGVIVAAPMTNVGATINSYTPPRELLITLNPNRVNLVPNPSMENGESVGWTGTNCAVAALDDIYYQDPNNFAMGLPNWCLKVTATAAGNVSVTTSYMPVSNLLGWSSGSAYVQPAGATRTTYVVLNFYNASHVLLGSANTTGAGQITVAEVMGKWARPYACTQLLTSPTNQLWASYASQIAYVTMTVTWVGCAANEIHYLDAAMYELSDSVGVYFDGDYEDALFTNFSDYQWAGGNLTKTGPSYFYKGFWSKFKRLDKVIAGEEVSAGVVISSTITSTGTMTAPTLGPGVAGSGQVLLSWTPPASDGGFPIVGYNVYVGTATGAENYALPANGGVLITGTQYTVTGLTNGTAYYFVVQAINALGLQTISNERSCTPIVPSSPPSAVVPQYFGPGYLVTVWEVPGTYNTPGAQSSGLEQFSGAIFGSGPGPQGITWVRSKYVAPGEVVF